MVPTLRSILAFSALSILATLSAGAPRPAAAATDCYAASEDADGDGYARNGAATDAECSEAGAVPRGGDCNDTRSYTHPNAPELAFNLTSDDCDALIDEPELVYFPNGNQNTKTSFSIRVRVASLDLLQQGSALAYDVEYADLAASGLPARTSKRLVGTLPSDYAFDAPVTGLSPARVYRARLHFYKATPTTIVVLGRPMKGTSFSSLGVSSEWYYSATAGDGLLEEARLDLLLDGFHQLSESDRGRIGYRGSVKRDGTRFGASPGEAWCSEFYAWLARARFFQIGGTNVGGTIWSFVLAGGWYPGSAAVSSVAERADYLPIDNDDDGDGDHSMMFLAYDATTGKAWTLEGNYGNAVRVNQRTIGAELLGVGHLKTGALIVANL
jgi:hypothetical protein